ncbi:2-succinyl-5-enolpyruvyl-6-hydroxy-3-cyclohexene-1-carboxylic-acid synthase [Candidatus Uabimicrobium sp. HlEnr_7]|uniref:2-succinyl-5-enolpyruvyl-6-hydroxy-3- cyclohexene-1-carboxylic-acid synthase n=1 Tax=Candidatus Uabimicrobium helgolandensis TaxID=3095367 RepID=UPI003555E90C
MMNIQYENMNVFWMSLIVEECIRNKVTQFCISPGSRSSPITCAIARAEKAQKKIFYDERAAAFYALGYARATGKPAVLVCTSGTAVANYLPAIVEASTDGIPLIVLSADRPPELLDTGANQTIIQPNMYGKYCSWQVNLPCSTEKIPLPYLLTTVDQGIYQAVNSPGVIHINCMLREPLAPIPENLSDHNTALPERWTNNNAPYTFYTQSKKCPLDISDIAKSLSQAQRGIIIVGRLNNNEDILFIAEFLHKCGWPVVPDICSGFRFKPHPNFLLHFDNMLLQKEQWRQYEPDCILHLGEQIVSKRILQFIGECKPETYIVVKSSSRRYDPFHAVTHHVQSNCGVFCRLMLDQIPFNIEENFKKDLLNNQQQVQRIQRDLLTNNDSLNELSTVFSIAQMLNIGTKGLFIGNSLAIRYFDMYSYGDKNIFVASNRGASGIDGNLATAIGMAQGLKGAVTVVLGDISLIHDLNSLSLLKNTEFPVCVVLLNNQGGSIFEKLPIANFIDIFEDYFVTPHSFTFENVAKMFSICYFQPRNQTHFTKIYRSCIQQKKTCLIEIHTQRDYNTQIQKELNRLIGCVDVS